MAGEHYRWTVESFIKSIVNGFNLNHEKVKKRSITEICVSWMNQSNHFFIHVDYSSMWNLPNFDVVMKFTDSLNINSNKYEFIKKMG